MLPTLYGKKSLQTTLSRMASGERLAQSFLFYGDAGLGRKTVAHWCSALLLCEHPENGQPCGHCKSCHNLQKDCHPDLILVPHSGKLGGFSVETVRQICSSVSIPPNNGSRKVYLFLDCDQMDDRAQNLLLKQLEEPPVAGGKTVLVGGLFQWWRLLLEMHIHCAAARLECYLRYGQRQFVDWNLWHRQAFARCCWGIAGNLHPECQEP